MIKPYGALALAAFLPAACAPQPAAGPSVQLACDRGVQLQVDYGDGLALVRVNGGAPIRLVATPTGSGTAYEGGGYALREHQGTVMWNGPTREAPYSCRQVMVAR